MLKEKKFLVCLGKDLYIELQLFAFATSESVAHVIRDAIKFYLKEKGGNKKNVENHD